MKIFKLINQIVEKDPWLNTKLYTFNVFTISKKVGLIQWIDDSLSMKTVIENKLEEKSIHENMSFVIKKEFLRTINKDY